MKTLSPDFFATLLEGGAERRNLEFKPPLIWTRAGDPWLREQVIRAILGMHNTRGGGSIVIGIKEEAPGRRMKVVGLERGHIDSFEDFDAIRGTLGGFAPGLPQIDMALGAYRGTQDLILLTVAEFERFPFVCLKDGDTKALRKDDLYVRSLKEPQTIRATQAELQEMIELAADKERRHLESRGWTRAASFAETYRERIRGLE